LLVYKINILNNYQKNPLKTSKVSIYFLYKTRDLLFFSGFNFFLGAETILIKLKPKTAKAKIKIKSKVFEAEIILKNIFFLKMYYIINSIFLCPGQR